MFCSCWCSLRSQVVGITSNQWSFDAIRYQVGNLDMELSSVELQNFSLLETKGILNRNGRSLRNFPPMPTPFVEVAHATNWLTIEKLDYDMSHEISRFESLARGLNSDQYHLFRLIVNSHHRGEWGLFFLYSSDGTGKTYLWNIIIFKFRSKKHVVLVVASSKIASLLIPSGKTTHSIFKISLQPDKTSICLFDKRSERTELIQETMLIIWD